MTDKVHPLFSALVSGDRGALGRAITLMESAHPKDQDEKLSLLSSGHSIGTDSVRIAVTGAPGVGKSSLIEHLGLYLISKGHKVAVLAIDPSSDRTGGSILGDKTRMPNLSRNPHAFIRPSPTSGVLGGVAQMTRETIYLCEAAGYDRIIVETVGIGQSETRVSTLTDVVLFVTMAGSGDGLQGIKRGVLEVIDVVAVNKSDGASVQPSEQFAAELAAALHLLYGSNAPPSVWLTSANTQVGLERLWAQLEEVAEHKMTSGDYARNRKKQLETWFEQATMHSMNQFIRHMASPSDFKEDLLVQVKSGVLHPYVAADRLVKKLMG